MPLHNRRLIIVVKAAAAAAANARAKELDSEGGERTFTVGLSTTGLPPVTHYWCSWQMDDDWDARIKENLQNAVDNGNAWVFNGNIRTPEWVLQQLGLKRVEVPVG
jgi:hypothetical protein